MAAGTSPNHRLQVGQSYRRTPDGSTCVQQEGRHPRCGCSQGREDGEGGEDSRLSDPLREGVSAPSACSPSLLAETL